MHSEVRLLYIFECVCFLHVCVWYMHAFHVIAGKTCTGTCLELECLCQKWKAFAVSIEYMHQNRLRMPRSNGIFWSWIIIWIMTLTLERSGSASPIYWFIKCIQNCAGSEPLSLPAFFIWVVIGKKKKNIYIYGKCTHFPRRSRTKHVLAHA